MTFKEFAIQFFIILFIIIPISLFVYAILLLISWIV
jgi:hypothetical protein